MPARLTELLGPTAVRPVGAQVVDVAVPRRWGRAGRLVRRAALHARRTATRRPSLVAKGPSDDPVSLATANEPAPLRARGPLLRCRSPPTVTIRTPRVPPRVVRPGDRALPLAPREPRARARRPTSSTASPRCARALAVDELAGLHAPHWGSSELAATSFVGRSPTRCAAPRTPSSSRALRRLPRPLRRRARRAPTRAVVEWLAPRLGAYYQAPRRSGDRAARRLPDRQPALRRARRRGAAARRSTGRRSATGPARSTSPTCSRRASTTEAAPRPRATSCSTRVPRRLGALGVTTGYDAARWPTDYAFHAFQGVVMLVCAAVLVERTERGDAMFLHDDRAMRGRGRRPRGSRRCWRPDAARARRPARSTRRPSRSPTPWAGTRTPTTASSSTPTARTSTSPSPWGCTPNRGVDRRRGRRRARRRAALGLRLGRARRPRDDGRADLDRDRRADARVATVRVDAPEHGLVASSPTRRAPARSRSRARRATTAARLVMDVHAGDPARHVVGHPRGRRRARRPRRRRGRTARRTARGASGPSASPSPTAPSRGAPQLYFLWTPLALRRRRVPPQHVRGRRRRAVVARPPRRPRPPRSRRRARSTPRGVHHLRAATPTPRATRAACAAPRSPSSSASTRDGTPR